MIHLLLSTLAMMGLTFLIGFFVAAVIKLIAYAADSFDFYGVSPGASENNLMNYYYSQDTREFFLREEEQAHVNKKNSKKLTNNKQ